MKNIITKILVLLLSIAFTGCVGRMLPGRMYATAIGNTLQFQIQTSYGNGRMEAYDPKTDERFTGEYSAFYKGQSSVYGSVGGTDVALIQPPSGANAFGILVGDKGRTIRLYFEIKPGMRPTGYGIGSDQNGNRYEVFF